MGTLMKVFPAIDIKNGKCVRLLKGDFNQSTEYEKSPIDQAKAFSDLGYKDIHVIDLDGALNEKPVNGKLIEEICKIKKLRIQIGGGIRSNDHIKKLIDIGVDRVILGTKAITDIKFLEDICKKFEKKIAVAIDVRDGYIALRGWKEQTKILASDFLIKIQNFGVSRIIYTDINRDGTLTRPNLEETFKFAQSQKGNNFIPVLVSGGVGTINDVVAVQKKTYDPRIEGLIIGKAIYDGRMPHDQIVRLTDFN